jgi:hypothetical protein
MDIKSLKEIVTSNLPEDVQKREILCIIADDRNAILYIMKILEHERLTNKELILDTNAELSRALMALDDKNVKTHKKAIVDPKWVAGEIKKHYLKWKDYITCTFNIDGIP